MDIDVFFVIVQIMAAVGVVVAAATIAMTVCMAIGLVKDINRDRTVAKRMDNLEEHYKDLFK